MTHKSAPLFSIVFCTIYAVVYGLKLTVFIYYPEILEFSFRPRPPSAGPAMLYYGWVATAGAAALIAFLLVPLRRAHAFWQAASWVFAIATMGFVIFHERGWLFP